MGAIDKKAGAVTPNSDTSGDTNDGDNKKPEPLNINGSGCTVGVGGFEEMYQRHTAITILKNVCH